MSCNLFLIIFRGFKNIFLKNIFNIMIGWEYRGAIESCHQAAPDQQEGCQEVLFHCT